MLRRVGFTLSTRSAQQYLICGNRVSQDSVWSACVSVLRLPVCHLCSVEEGSLILLGQHPDCWCCHREGCKATLKWCSLCSAHTHAVLLSCWSKSYGTFYWLTRTRFTGCFTWMTAKDCSIIVVVAWQG